jgi:hypothetical protein
MDQDGSKSPYKGVKRGYAKVSTGAKWPRGVL